MDAEHSHLEHDRSDASAPRRVRRGSGERSQRRREQERARRRRRALQVVGGLAVLLAVGLGGPPLVDAVGPTVAGWFSGDDDAEAVADGGQDAELDEDGVPTVDPRPTVLLVTTDDAEADVTAIQLLSVDVETGRGSLVLLPTEMVADVPGYGFLPVGDAGSFGGTPLLELALENQLGISIDATATLSQQDWGAVFSRTGGFEVDVRQPLTTTASDGSRNRRFEPGLQFLDGPRLAELLTFDVDGEDELTSFSRTQQVMEGFLGTLLADDGALDVLFEDGAPMMEASDVEVVERALRASITSGTDGVTVLTLPVTVVGSGESRFYRLDDSRLESFVASALGGEDASDVEQDGVRLEVLNGNGQVGIGAEVGELLVPLGHTIVLTGNADDFDHPRTRILVYSDEDEVLAAAQEILQTLGVGVIERSDLPSAIVDITVLVGADFRR